MIRINIYIPEELNKRLDFAARSKHKVKAEVIRESLEKGLEVGKPQLNRGLLELIKLADKIPSKANAPTDVSKNHDYYAWGGQKRK